MPLAERSSTTDVLRAIDPDTLVLIGNVGRPGDSAEHALRSLGGRASSPIGVVDTGDHTRLDGPAILAATGGVAADLAVICALPSDEAIVAAQACAAAGVAGIAIVEVPASQELTAELRAIAGAGIRIIGPNAFGPYNARGKLFMRPYAGHSDSGVAIFTQSGNFLSDVVGALAAVSDSAPRLGWALGRTLDLDLAEAVEVAASEDEVRAIALHCEGMSEGRRLIAAMRSAAERKPIVLLLAGTSEAGKRVTISHTASLGVREAVATGAATQAGATVAGRIDEFAILADSLGRTWPAYGNRVAIMADGGGHATLAADRLIHEGFEIAPLTTPTVARISTLVGYEIDPHGPLDVDDLDRPSLGFQVAAVLAADPAVDIVFLVGALGTYSTHFANDALVRVDLEGARTLTEATATIRKPIVAALIHSSPSYEAHRVLREGGVVVLRSIDHAATVCRALAQRGRFLQHVDARSTIPDLPPPPLGGQPGRTMTEPEARAMLAHAGVDTGGFVVVRTAAECADAVDGFHRPCALKIVSPSIVHKADVGGVILDVTPAITEASFEALLDGVSNKVSGFEFDGVLVTPMATRGVELLVGAYRDSDLGPCIAVGSGGLLVELMRDIVFRTAPVTRFEAEEMLLATRAATLLDGYRGSETLRRELVIDLIASVSQLIADRPELEEIDLNPVIVAADGPQLVDVRVVARA